ncbi:hypothetical protein [Streptomyces sp. NPDC001435]|uniref:hypothetical protein n=1 Tax=unclassified Streptomyces TaxID=2593676 RepID=UPI0036A12C66
MADGQDLLRPVQGVGQGFTGHVPPRNFAGQRAQDRVTWDTPLQLLVEREPTQDLGSL